MMCGWLESWLFKLGKGRLLEWHGSIGTTHKTLSWRWHAWCYWRWCIKWQLVCVRKQSGKKRTTLIGVTCLTNFFVRWAASLYLPYKYCFNTRNEADHYTKWLNQSCFHSMPVLHTETVWWMAPTPACIRMDWRSWGFPFMQIVGQMQFPPILRIQSLYTLKKR